MVFITVTQTQSVKMKKDLLNATVIQDWLETEQQTAKVGNASA